MSTCRCNTPTSGTDRHGPGNHQPQEPRLRRQGSRASQRRADARRNGRRIVARTMRRHVLRAGRKHAAQGHRAPRGRSQLEGAGRNRRRLHRAGGTEFHSRVLHLLPARQHRREGAPHSPPARVPARDRSAPAARRLRHAVAAARRGHRPRRGRRRVRADADRAGVHGAPDRADAPHDPAQGTEHRPPAGRPARCRAAAAGGCRRALGDPGRGHVRLADRRTPEREHDRRRRARARAVLSHRRALPCHTAVLREPADRAGRGLRRRGGRRRTADADPFRIVGRR